MKYLGLMVAMQLALITGCSPTPESASPTASLELEYDHYGMDDYSKVKKIDAHVHANTKDASFLQQAKLDNFTLLSVNVDYPDFPSIKVQREVALYLQRQDTQSFNFAATFSMDNWQSPNWQSNVKQSIDLAKSQGAKAVKTWKNIGMTFREPNGDLVMIDNPKFDSVFAHMQSIDLPVIGHQGEPKNCWLPLEEMTVNNDRQYFAAHPEYHMYLHPEFPSYEDQMAARDNMLAKNSALPFMGAHMASLEWSVDELAKFFDTNPKAVADIAARSGQIQYQSQQNREKVRAFFIEYQDRILYATDLTHGPGRDPQEFKTEAHNKWRQDWKYLNTTDIFQVPEVDGDIMGLALPKQVIDKIYRLNAQRFFSIDLE